MEEGNGQCVAYYGGAVRPNGRHRGSATAHTLCIREAREQNRCITGVVINVLKNSSVAQRRGVVSTC